MRTTASFRAKHFKEELLNEGLDFSDALYVLERGLIIDPPEQNIKSGEWKYRIEGYEPNGIYLAIVFCFKAVDQALLITVFSIARLSK